MFTNSFFYDPDFSVTLASDSGDGGNGSDTQTLLLAILIPVLVVLALLIVLAIIVATVGIILWRRYALFHHIQSAVNFSGTEGRTDM